MGLYLFMDGVDDVITVPSITFNQVEFDVVFQAPFKRDILVAGNCNLEFHYDGNNLRYSSFSQISIDDELINYNYSNMAKFHNKRVKLVGHTSSNITNTVRLFTNSSKVYGVKFLLNNNVVAEYDFTTGNSTDLSGNGKIPTISGGTFMTDRSENAVVIVKDSFDNLSDGQPATLTETGQGWMGSSGTAPQNIYYGVDNGKIHNKNAQVDGRMYVETGKSDNLRLGVTLQNSVNVSGISFRQGEGSSQNCYILSATGSISIQRRGGGLPMTTLISKSLTGIPEPRRIEVVLNGSSMKIFCNDIYMGEVIDDTHTNNTRHGLWQHYSESPMFDDFLIEELVAEEEPIEEPPTKTPSIEILSVSRYKISSNPPVDESHIKVKFDTNVEEWTANILGVSHDTGTVAVNGGAVNSGDEIDIVIDWTKLQEGVNRINIYGRNALGWTPYNEEDYVDIPVTFSYIDMNETSVLLDWDI